MFEQLDPVVLARAQFAFTVSFHFVFPAFSIGLASYLMVLEALWLRDLIPEEPSEYPKAIEVGVLGAMVGQVGALESSEAIKLLAGFGEPLVGRVMVMDAAAGRWGVVPLRSRRC